MLTVNNIEVKYLGVILVLRGVYMEVRERQIVSLLGANGAGKTTVLKAISGLLKSEEGEVTDGKIEFLEERVDKKNPEELVRLGIIQILEGRRVFQHLTIEENLLVGSTNPASTKTDLEKCYGYFEPLKRMQNRITGYLSGGEQQMLVIARALMARPKLMLLDEPSMGLAPLLVQEIFGIVSSLMKDEDMSVLLVEQNALAALSIADYGYVMESGKIVLDGAANELRENEDVKEFYLGLSDLGKRRSYREVKHYKRRKRWLG
ncbi:MAG: ABC transporter ATP-binding protein [Deltaproteobacteria bacterium]|nr:ABC transporter ATP-binding protein [Deltaproteobacteria bacterium]